MILDADRRAWCHFARRLFGLITAFLLHATLASAQPVSPATAETGLPPLRVFSPRDYAAGTQNWAIAQDPRGLIYVGNNDGVLEFDGQRWRLIRVNNKSVVRSLAVDDAGRVYVGAISEFGWLQSDPLGQVHYVSLRDRLPADAPDFSDVWHIFSTAEGVVFCSYQAIFRLRAEGVDVWRPQRSFHRAFAAGDRVFVREAGRGLLELVDDQWRLVPGGELLADERVYAVEAFPDPHPASGIWIAGRSLGLLQLDGAGISPVPGASGAPLLQGLVYSSARLADGRIAFGTLQEGLLLLDGTGQPAGSLQRRDGLPDNGVLALAEDRDGGVWLALNRGLARAELGSPLSRFDERNGLLGEVYALHRHGERLYAGTSQGVYQLRAGPRPEFVRIAGIEGQTWAFLSVGATLLVANYEGVYAITEGAPRKIRSSDQAFALAASTSQPKRVFVGSRNGLASLIERDGTWHDEGMVAGIDDEIRTMVEHPAGQLWLATRNSGILRVQPQPGAAVAGTALPGMVIERFGVSAGLPSAFGNGVYALDGALAFSTGAGLFHFDRDTSRFAPDPRFARVFGDRPMRLSNLVSDGRGGVWLYAENPDTGLTEAGRVMREGGALVWDATPLRALVGSETPAMHRIHRDADGVTWFGGSEGVFRLDPRIVKDYRRPFAALIRRVLGQDAVPIELDPARPLEFAQRRLRFEFAAPSFDGSTGNRFQVRLDGEDTDWSPWSTETYADYSNLSEGHYRFRVRAMNFHGMLSEEASVSFQLLPPWYRTWGAYLGYVVLLIATLRQALHWRSRRQRAQTEALEQRVRERTTDILKLGEIGQELTATLDFDQALARIHSQVSARLDAHVFCVSIYSERDHCLRDIFLSESGTRFAGNEFAMDEHDRPAVWCVRERRELVTSQLSELANYVGSIAAPKSGERMESIIYLPLRVQDRVIGCLSVQSPRRGAYGADQIEFLRVLSSYTAIALDNSSAYRQLQVALSELQRSQRQLEEISLTDPLTGLRNRRFLEHHIDADLAQARRHYLRWVETECALPQPLEADLIVFLVDLDHFKQVNDGHGHAAGDRVLVQMRDRLQQVFRRSDHLVRWGGEEFLVVARQTSRNEAAGLAERIRQTVAGVAFDVGTGQLLSKTASIGFACFPLAPTVPTRFSWHQVVEIADRCLYAAKQGGRDRWVGALQCTEAGLVVNAEVVVEDFLGAQATQAGWLQMATRQ